MMLVILLLGSLGVGAVLAVGSIMATWLRYAPDWDALALEMGNGDCEQAAFGTKAPAATQRMRAPVQPALFRAKLPVGQPMRGVSAAA